MWLIWPVANHRAVWLPRDHDVTPPEVTGFQTPITGSARKSLGDLQKPSETAREETGNTNGCSTRTSHFGLILKTLWEQSMSISLVFYRQGDCRRKSKISEKVTTKDL